MRIHERILDKNRKYNVRKLEKYVCLCSHFVNESNRKLSN
jgi:hypothetical protein